MSRVERTGRRVLARGASTACALLIVLAGCSTARSSLGTTSGGCFLELPAATAAVHHRGHLVGAKLLTVAALRRDRSMEAVVRSSRRPRDQLVCLVAFEGTFDAKDVSRPFGRRAGHAAVVAIGYPHGGLLGTVMFGRLPERFGHLHLG